MPDLYFNHPYGETAGRQLRARHDDLAELADRALRRSAGGAARRLIQIYDGGAIPTAPDHYFLSYPVELDGSEIEGGGGTPVVDTTQTIVVDVIGHKPAAGDLLVAYAVGGRWVAQGGGASGSITVPCSPCAIRKTDLTVSWTNLISGPGSATLTHYNLPDRWISGCVDGLIYEILCSGGDLEFLVTYFLSGDCPTGQSNSCSNFRVYPFGLTLSAYTCSPFSATFEVSECPEIEGPGYTTFTVTP